MTHSGPVDLSRLDEIEMPTERRFELPRTTGSRALLIIAAVLGAMLLAAAVVYAMRPPVLPERTTVRELPSPYAQPRR